ncbi:glucokinase [Striga asiatica]|uniref:Glucokinase n=1 Tax=Striga asiatica TaxID=4170 RepID=A0A5A7PAR0_STRAF|nr:glucokinase [Striga asiatica]
MQRAIIVRKAAASVETPSGASDFIDFKNFHRLNSTGTELAAAMVMAPRSWGPKPPQPCWQHLKEPGPLDMKLWLHISIRGSNMGTSTGVPSACLLPYKRNALDETADIAHPSADASISCPPKGWSSSFTFSSSLFINLSNSRRKRHLLFTLTKI